MKKLNMLAAAILTMASATSFAQSSKDAGFYGIANFGFTTTKGTGSGTYENSTTTYTSESKGAGNAWNLGLGYDFDKKFAAEATIGNFWKHDDEYTDTSEWGTGKNTSKSNVMALTLTGLYKHQISDNVKLFAGPTIAFLKAKFSDEQAYTNNGGYAYQNSSERKVSKTLPGLVFGSSIAIDKKTDLRLSMTKYKTWNQTGDDGLSQEATKITTYQIGVAMKF